MSSYKQTSIRIAGIMLLGLFFAACSGGDDGKDGTDGAAGPVGPAGPAGPEGPSSGGGVPIDSADRINIAVTGVDVPAGGGAPTVFLTLTNDLEQGLKDLPAGDIRFVLAQLTPGSDGGSSEWQSYITRDTGGIVDGQATAEKGSDGALVDNGDGTYEYTFASDLTAYPAGPVFDATKTHRLGIEIRGQAPISSNGIHDFVPAGGVPMFERKIVDNDTCDACHDRLEFHGGPRTDVEYCVTCHNPYSVDGDSGNTVDMKALMHNIHSGRDGYVIFGHNNSEHDYSDIHWTQDVRNCQTCHEENDLNTPQASNWRLVPNRASCGTCHFDDGDPANGEHDYAIEDGTHPFGQQFADDTQCTLCHGPDSVIADAIIANAHAIPEDIAAEAFEYKVVGITDTNPGDTPTASIQVLNPKDPNYAADPESTAYDINDPAGPFQASRARLRLDIAWTTDMLANLDPNGELGRPAADGAPFGPIAIDFLTDATTTDGITFTKMAPAAIPSTATGSGLAILEGRPRVEVDIDGTPTMVSLAVAANSLPFAITDTDDMGDPDPQDRRKIVDIGKCNDCHKNLSLHGDNRSGNTEVCSTCHNPNATDIQQRGVADSDCDNDLGPTEVTIDLKRMVHQIHSGNTAICGYNNSAHSYFDVVYPGHLNNCEGCHLPGTFYPVDGDEVLATTVLTGADRSILSDDTAISPNTAICSGCHASGLAIEHMIHNGGDFEAGKDETGALISSSVETCELCHDQGRSADVSEMHGVSGFEFN
jgi:OmcA/MtrC family decaheme c-type cytochrome